MKNESIEFETLKRNKKRIYFLCGFVCAVILLIVLITNNSLAKYRIIESIPLVNGTINYTPYDLKMVAMYQEENGDYESIDTVPTSGYSLNEEKSYCEVNDTKDNNITIEYQNGVINFLGMSKKGTRCYLYFVESKTLKDTILANSKVNEGEPDFSQVATTDEGIYKTEDDWGESYYFRGAVENNYVKFAGYYWRIIRINGDGSVRMIYQGTSPTDNDTNAQIAKSYYNSNYYKSEYVGYMYTLNELHGLTNSSTIKELLDNWYTKNLSNYVSNIEISQGFCNDRSLDSGIGIGSKQTYFKAYYRLEKNKNPSLKCENNTDLFTVKESEKGNRALDNPIGLITADEVVYAGGNYKTNNQSYYLRTEQYYWTMTPYGFDDQDIGQAAILFITATGSLDYYYAGDNMGNILGVRPVINLAHDVTIKSGNGTSSTPYEI